MAWVSPFVLLGVALGFLFEVSEAEVGALRLPLTAEVFFGGMVRIEDAWIGRG